ncbi:MAG TPA: KUP/HAK/KT family potassium transporter [Smithellaceae bacterium]|nr:KUP/HAK/KT family potassium transporter [Smithellaceae bacterium]HRV45103.1 KUP/HAK/KT family potassium transporter [Smithellaceae bacterium]
MKSHHREPFWSGVVRSMGIVFGDIGTSPIYTLTVVFALTPRTEASVLGILSLVVWTLLILVTGEYAWLAMSLSYKGQGGEIMLREILRRALKPGRKLAFAGFLAFVGVSLLLGDGVITPAITLLSAVEGIVLIPGLENVRGEILMLVAILIAIGLFAIQSRGVDKVAGIFGPIMAVWFSCLALTGMVSLAAMPGILKAVNPYYAFAFLSENGLAGFFVLSEVILCATGGEALYADMGHLGRKPILHAWYFVFAALLLNYMGQGVFAVTHPDVKYLLFGMVQHQASFLYIPFLLLTFLATIIASQSIISGTFSIVYQGITTRILPLMKVDYTSSRIKSQIHIPFVSWGLMVAVIFMILLFQKSENLAAAYGMAVTGSMTITGLMMILIFSQIKKIKWKLPAAVFITAIAFMFFLATLSKLPHGAYWSLILAAVPLTVILIWTKGQKRLFKALRPLDWETFFISYQQIYAKGRNILGTALFFCRGWQMISPYIVHTIFRSNIIYERNILISINRTDEPFGVEVHRKQDLGPGLEALEVEAGYREILDIEALIKEQGIQEKVIFYGVEDIVTRNPLWGVFSLIKRISPNFVQFSKLPPSRLQGIVTRVEM